MAVSPSNSSNAPKKVRIHSQDASTPKFQHFKDPNFLYQWVLNRAVYVFLFHFRALAFRSFFATLRRRGILFVVSEGPCMMLYPSPTPPHLCQAPPHQVCSSAKVLINATFKDNGRMKPRSCRKTRVRANSPNKASYSCPVATICYTLKFFDVCFSLMAT